MKATKTSDNAKAIRLTVANPRLPGRREYNLKKVLDNPIHVTDPNIADLFMVVLLKARQFSASDYLSQLPHSQLEISNSN